MRRSRQKRKPMGTRNTPIEEVMRKVMKTIPTAVIHPV